jgi:hypothetical protein
MSEGPPKLTLPQGGVSTMQSVDAQGRRVTHITVDDTAQSHVKPNNESKPGPIGNCVGCVLPETSPNLSSSSTGPGVKPENKEEDDFEEWRSKKRDNEEIEEEVDDLLNDRKEAIANNDQKALNEAELRLEVMREDMIKRGIEPSAEFKQYKLESLGMIGQAFLMRMRMKAARKTAKANASGGGRVDGPKAKRNPCAHPNDAKKKKKYVVYKADEYDKNGNKIGTYVGRTSGDPSESTRTILKRRHGGHHRNIGQPEPLFETDSYSGVRGAEQIYKDKLGTSKQIEPIRPKHKDRQDYIDCAKSKGAG